MNEMKRVLGTVVVLSVLSVTAWAQDKVLAVYKQGEVAYIQDGKQGKLPLFAGRPVGQNALRETPKGRHLGLMFTTKDQPAVLELVITLTDKGAKVTLLTLRDGPAGTSYFAYARSKCTVTLTRADANGAEGAVTCAGVFEGPAVSSLSFRATP